MCSPPDGRADLPRYCQIPDDQAIRPASRYLSPGCTTCGIRAPPPRCCPASRSTSSPLASATPIRSAQAAADNFAEAVKVRRSPFVERVTRSTAEVRDPNERAKYPD